MNYWKEWTKAAGIRAVKTIAQTALGLLTIGAAVSDVDWRHVVSVALVAGLYSLLTSLAGLPELEGKKEEDEECVVILDPTEEAPEEDQEETDAI